jgi:hypothetical protein
MISTRRIAGWHGPRSRRRLSCWDWRRPLPSASADHPELEVWQKQVEKQIQRALTRDEKNILREAARARYAQAYGVEAKTLNAQVHHSDPLEWAHLKPKADPNRLANLWALEGEAHNLATQAWRQFKLGLGGRTPSLAEQMAKKLRVDKMVEPYIIRPGASPRPPSPIQRPPEP